VRAQGGWGKHKELPRTLSKPQSEHEATPERLCERSERPVRGGAKCERTIELPQNAETGAPRADANDGEKAGVKLAKMLKWPIRLFGGVKRRQQNQKFPSFQMFRFAAGGVGGAAIKNDRKFLGFAPRELVERGRGAKIIRQNPADSARNTFELCPANTAMNQNGSWLRHSARLRSLMASQ